MQQRGESTADDGCDGLSVGGDGRRFSFGGSGVVKPRPPSTMLSRARTIFIAAASTEGAIIVTPHGCVPGKTDLGDITILSAAPMRVGGTTAPQNDGGDPMSARRERRRGPPEGPPPAQRTRRLKAFHM